MRHHWLAKRAAQSMVEFAMIATVLFTLLFGIFEFGRAFYAYSAVVNAAQEGARLGIVTGVDTTPKQTAIISATIQSAYAISLSDVSIACPGGSCSGLRAGDMFTVSVVYTFTAVTPLVPDLVFRGQSSMMID